MSWHQFSTVQFPCQQFVWKARLVQFGARGPSASAQFVQFSSSTLPDLTRIDLGGSVRLSLGSIHRVSNCSGGAEGFPPAEIQDRRPGVSRLGEGMVRFALCTCLLARGVVWCPNDENSVQNRLKKFVQFACLVGSVSSSLSSVRGTAIFQNQETSKYK